MGKSYEICFKGLWILRVLYETRLRLLQRNSNMHHSKINGPFSVAFQDCLNLLLKNL